MKSPTAYADVNAVLEQLLAGARAALRSTPPGAGDRFAGLYLYGSLATGDFDPSGSDIDFVVATHGPLDDATVAALEAFHASLAESGMKWAAKLEGAYVPLTMLRRHDPVDAEVPHINEGRFYLSELGSDWIIQRHILREQCLALAGPDLRDYIDPVTPDDLREAVRETLRDWWAPMLETPDPRLAGGEYCAYAVLSMCRALHTLETGGIASKRASAAWATDALDVHWRPLIEQAAAWRPGAPMAGQDVVLEFMRYALTCASCS
jgi:Aminoglycoside adenylyltransferase, C-terminal domain/Nucleotidyltransferase domain